MFTAFHLLLGQLHCISKGFTLLIVCQSCKRLHDLRYQLGALFRC